jgi:hypothetical protein
LTKRIGTFTFGVRFLGNGCLQNRKVDLCSSGWQIMPDWVNKYPTF